MTTGATPPTPPSKGPAGAPKAPPAEKKGKPDIWTQVMFYGLIVGMLDAYNVEVTMTARAMHQMLTVYYNQETGIDNDIKSRGALHKRRVDDDPTNPNADPTYETDIAALKSRLSQVQNLVSQTEATLNGVLQAASNNIKYAMSTIQEIGQELSRIISGSGG